MKGSGATKQLREQVLDTGLCAHCGACVNLCPYYLSCDDRIVVRDECTITDGSCLDVCPRQPTDLSALRRLLFDEKDMTPEIGAMKAFYVVRAAEEKTREGAQHGGTVTALVDLALEAGLVDAAVVSGAANPLLPDPVVVTEAGQAGRSSGSRFVATPNVARFNELAKGETASIAVVATPCQALALAKMRRSGNPRIEENSKKIGLVIGLFCGWALSSSALTALLATKIDLDSIIGMDIPPSQYHRLDVFTPAGTVSISLDEVQECVRSSCHTCSDMTAEFADISVGSARLPGGWQEARSWNQVIVRTERGRRLMELALSRNVLEFRDVPGGNLDKLKKASLNKKRAGDEALRRTV